MKWAARRGWASLLALVACSTRPAVEAEVRARQDGPALVRVPLSRLRVTEGALRSGPDETFVVEGARMRAVVSGTTGTTAAELRFTVLGPTGEQRALASGDQRQQVGLKLRALDGCNLLYVMWRSTPKAGLVVSYKRNPDEHHSQDCGNRGYVTVHAENQHDVEAPSPGSPHVLRAVQDGARLKVWADERLAWEGVLPATVMELSGPVGVRSDNLRLTFQLLTTKP